jgi:hypothetical protein
MISPLAGSSGPVLEQDLILTPDMGIAHITQDDFGNTYDRAGGAYRNFKP